jgi:NNP family nitrate/nitrite transporter-like MFS transporter
MFLAFTLAFTVPNFSQYQLTPLAARIMEQYSLTNLQFTSIFSAPMIPAVFLSFVSGILVDKYGFKVVVGIPIIIAATGSILRVFSDSFATLYISMVLVGFSGGIIVSNAAKIIGSVFEPRKIGVFVSIGISICTFTMIGAMSTTALLPSTRTAFIIAAVLGTVSVVFWYVAVPKRRKRNEDELARFQALKIA